MSRPKRESWRLAAQDLDLVAQHCDLDILGMLAPQASGQGAEEATGDRVEEGQGHRRIVHDLGLAAQRTRPGF
jgi:hypothetical protein